ncbi:MAG: glycoside hydrolase family 1 protein [Elusimicrobia bacterium]|nr:glycoside hydrolase family 1 protein [Elusimicrobiota bacterium]
MAIITFPRGFLWGVSTSSYQNEGGNRGSAFWDWEARRGWERSAEAARSWELFDEDLRLLRELNLTACRFSVEWARVQPAPDRFDEEALARYAAWARRLAEHGIRPLVTLHHFSEPAWLLRLHPGGWLEAGVPERFLRFAERVAAALGGAVADWVVFNEPMVFLLFAYGLGHFPPGRRLLWRPQRTFQPVLLRGLIRAHNDCYRLIHRLQPGARVGAAHHVSQLEPARPGDEAAVARWDRFMHRDFLDGTKDCLDFLGLNYYTRVFVSSSRLPGLPAAALPGFAEVEKGLTRPLFRLLGGRRGGGPPGGTGWEIVPEGLGAVALKYWEEYRKPVWITENGVADEAGADREAFLRGHLASLARAAAQGADLRGYLHWTLVDNYEWGTYRHRFGLCDRARRPKPGASFYAETARRGWFEG